MLLWNDSHATPIRHHLGNWTESHICSKNSTAVQNDSLNNPLCPMQHGLYKNVRNREEWW